VPELPEVETVIQDLLKTPIINSSIDQVRVYWPRTVGSAVDFFAHSLEGKSICHISRRGKYLIFYLNDGRFLIVHLRMSGQFFLYPNMTEKGAHVHVTFAFSSGYQLHFHDPRKFGRMEIVDDLAVYFSRLGVEPLSMEFSFDVFDSLMQKNRIIKAHLLDQSVIAGLGNIYVDEALWHAKIHPEIPAKNLSAIQKKALYSAIPYVLQKGLSFKGTSLGRGLGNFHAVNGKVGEHQEHLSVVQRKGRPCLRCSTTITKIFVAQRGTHLCPSCQLITK